MAKSPWDPEMEELIKKAQMMIDTGAVDGERPKRPMSDKAKSTMKRSNIKKSKGGSTTAQAARREAIRKFNKGKLIGGQIPASPTR